MTNLDKIKRQGIYPSEIVIMMIETLEFYANSRNYDIPFCEIIIDDKGDEARKALYELIEWYLNREKEIEKWWGLIKAAKLLNESFANDWIHQTSRAAEILREHGHVVGINKELKEKNATD